jgi:hypothetical protein
VSTVATRPLRWSSVRVCPRKAVYEAEDAPARERSDRENRILYRGRSLGRDYADFLAARDGEDSIEREVKVTWPLGTGHIDVFHKPTGTVIEVLSSAFANDQMIHSKLLQAVGYMEHHAPTKAGLLVVLNPSDFSEERFPIAMGTDAYQALVDEMRDRIDQLERWRDEGQLPDRVCRRPSEAIGRFCLHAEHCFMDWQPPELEELQSVEAVELAQAWLSVKAREREANETAAAAKAERADVEAQLDDLGIEHGKVAVGPFTVTRSDRTRHGSLDVTKAEIAGVLNREMVAEFFKPDSHFTVWTIEATGHDIPVGDRDFGEAPF